MFILFKNLKYKIMSKTSLKFPFSIFAWFWQDFARFIKWIEVFPLFVLPGTAFELSVWSGIFFVGGFSTIYLLFSIFAIILLLSFFFFFFLSISHWDIINLKEWPCQLSLSGRSLSLILKPQIHSPSEKWFPFTWY